MIMVGDILTASLEKGHYGFIKEKNKYIKRKRRQASEEN